MNRDDFQPPLEDNTPNGLPEGWCWAELNEIVNNPKSDIVDGPFGSDLKSFEYTDKGIPIIRIQNVDRTKFIEKNIQFISAKKAEELKRHNFHPGDIVITKLGDPLGKACTVPENFGPGIIVADIVRLRLNHEVCYVPYLVHGINSEPVSEQLLRHIKGTTRPRVNLGHIRSLKIPLAPLSEQKRIAAKVGELLARVNTTKERLVKVSMILKRFRQAVLAAACSGRLTTDWREQQTILESASALLARLQQQHLRMDNSGFLENDLPEIPENWIWAKVGQLGDVTTGGTPSKKEASYFGGSIPFFKPTDLDAAYNVVKSIDSLTEEGAEIARILPPLAVMVTCIGATIGKTGLGRVVGATNQQINSVVTNHEFVSPYWLFWTFTSPWVQEQIKLHASETTLPILNKGRFEKLFLPFPPLNE